MSSSRRASSLFLVGLLLILVLGCAGQAPAPTASPTATTAQVATPEPPTVAPTDAPAETVPVQPGETSDPEEQFLALGYDLRAVTDLTEVYPGVELPEPFFDTILEKAEVRRAYTGSLLSVHFFFSLASREELEARWGDLTAPEDEVIPLEGPGEGSWAIIHRFDGVESHRYRMDTGPLTGEVSFSVGTEDGAILNQTETLRIASIIYERLLEQATKEPE